MKLGVQNIPKGGAFIAGICLTVMLFIWFLHIHADAGTDPVDDCDPRNDLCAQGCP